MVRFVKILGPGKRSVFFAFCCAQVNKMNPLAKSPNHTGQIIIGTDAQRTSTECDAVGLNSTGVHQLRQVGFGTDHTRQTQQRIRRIVGVNAQIDADLLRNRSHLLNKLIKVLAKRRVVDGGVFVQ